jgi:hypothetical protein
MSIDAIGATTPSQAIQTSAVSAVTADATAAFSSTAATNASGLGNFFQQFATDLQSLLTQTQAATSGTTSSATTTPADTTTQAAANQFVGQVAQVLGGGSGNAAPAPGATANGANTLATDIVRALQNYGAFANNPTAATISTIA